MSTPSDFAKAEIEFKKLDDLPNKGLGKPYTPDEIMQAMKVLHKMIHAQAHAYGGKNSKLLPAGIAEGSSLLASVTNTELVDTLTEGIDHELDRAYRKCEQLRAKLGKDAAAMDLLLGVIKHINSALRMSHEGK